MKKIQKEKNGFLSKLDTRNYSKVAREKLADSMFSVSTNIISAIIISIVVAPMVAAFNALSTPEDDGLRFFRMFFNVATYEGWAFILIYLVAIVVGVWSRLAAMRIYTELYPDEAAPGRRTRSP